jgi:WD40 repeat protein
VPASGVSCLDYDDNEKVLATGSRDIGKVQIWKRTEMKWDVVHNLQGHSHGIRAVA